MPIEVKMINIHCREIIKKKTNHHNLYETNLDSVSVAVGFFVCVLIQ